MYLIPLSQPESVELVIHALRVAGGEADCNSCPVRKVCMKQCLTIATAVAKMVAVGTLPSVGAPPEPPPEPSNDAQRPGLKVVK
jgi:hypothetical protein